MGNRHEIIRSTATNSIRFTFLIMMAMWVGGCNNFNNYIPQNEPIPKGRSIVFGDIAMGSPVSNWLTEGRLTVINALSSETVLLYPIEGLGGPFYWSLPPGKYVILDLQEVPSEFNRHILGFTNYSRSRGIYADFSIDSDQAIVYVGTLGLLSPSSPPTVINDFDTAVQAFHNRFPAINTEPLKQLLQLEKRK